MNLADIKMFGLKRKHRVRVGRGIGSGLGKTSGRGMKGFHARQGHKIGQVTEGGTMPLYRRLPKRGFKHTDFDDTWIIINLEDLNVFQEGEEVSLSTIAQKGLLKLPKSKKDLRLKLLARGEVKVKNLKLKLHKISEEAQKKIAQVQGTVELIVIAKPKKKPRRKSA